MIAHTWQTLCASEDTGSGQISRPWVHEETVYATDGRAMVSCPLRRHRGQAIWEPDRGDLPDPPVAEALSLFAGIDDIDPVRAHMWSLMCWAGPPAALDRRCETCGGLGTVGRVPSSLGDYYDDCYSVGPDDPQTASAVPGDSCPECDGEGMVPSEPEPVSLYGVTVDARLLARLLWALVRLVRWPSPEHAYVRVGDDRIWISWGDARAIQMGLRGGEPVRTWEVTP